MRILRVAQTEAPRLRDGASFNRWVRHSSLSSGQGILVWRFKGGEDYEKEDFVFRYSVSYDLFLRGAWPWRLFGRAHHPWCSHVIRISWGKMLFSSRVFAWGIISFWANSLIISLSNFCSSVNSKFIFCAFSRGMLSLFIWWFVSLSGIGDRVENRF